MVCSLKWIGLLICSCAFQSARAEVNWVTPHCGAAKDVQYGTFYSDAAEGEVSYHVLLPPSYHKQTNRKFPVIYWLHGTNGSSRGCGGISFVADFYSRLMLQDQMPEAIVVFPNGLDHGMWCDAADGSQRPESMLIHDLIPFIDSTYRTIPTRRSRAIEGFSMGGYGAGRIGFKHSPLFGAITMYGAGPLQTDFLVDNPRINPLRVRQKIFREVYGADMDYYASNLPSSLALKVLEESHLRDQPSLRIVVGQDDALREYNELLSKKLREDLGLSHVYREIERAGHEAKKIVQACEDETAVFYTKLFAEREE
jgi:S-formylglutathione hydrolase FrmB